MTAKGALALLLAICLCIGLCACTDAKQAIKGGDGLIRWAEMKARTSIMGQRIAMRIIIWKVICRLATSEGSRVTMDAEEK